MVSGLHTKESSKLDKLHVEIRVNRICLCAGIIAILLACVPMLTLYAIDRSSILEHSNAIETLSEKVDHLIEVQMKGLDALGHENDEKGAAGLSFTDEEVCVIRKVMGKFKHPRSKSELPPDIVELGPTQMTVIICFSLVVMGVIVYAHFQSTGRSGNHNLVATNKKDHDE